MSVENTCAFTGHREITKKPDILYITALVQMLIDKGFENFLCGMAMGFDLIAAEIVLRLRKSNPHIKLIACVPCPEQEKYYPKEEKEKYKNIIRQCDEVRVISDHYFNGCMQLRDRYMVDNSCEIIGYYNKSSGGTHYTLKYAAEKNRKLHIV